MNTVKEMLDEPVRFRFVGQTKLTPYDFVEESYPLLLDLNLHPNLYSLTYDEYFDLVEKHTYNYGYLLNVPKQSYLMLQDLKKLHLIHKLKSI